MNRDVYDDGEKIIMNKTFLCHFSRRRPVFVPRSLITLRYVSGLSTLAPKDFDLVSPALPSLFSFVRVLPSRDALPCYLVCPLCPPPLFPIPSAGGVWVHVRGDRAETPPVLAGFVRVSFGIPGVHFRGTEGRVVSRLLSQSSVIII